MTTFEIMLERDTANDVSAMMAAVLVKSGSAVLAGEPIFEVENSKATEEYVAPGTGILMHDLVAGQVVNFGVVIARVMPAGEASTHAASPPALAVLPPVAEATMPQITGDGTRGEARFSLKAASMLTKYGLSAAQFDKDFVTSADVLAHVKCSSALGDGLLIPSVKAAIEKQTGASVGARKRAEIEMLSDGAGHTMLSVLGMSLGALLVRRQPGDFFTGQITDLVLFEASRLMRKYPKLNAFYADGEIFLHESVHAGLAIDDGGRLMVYGLENTDRRGLPELGEEIADAVARYVSGGLTAQELKRATFTVTDLSAGELDFVLPLLPKGQSCILGITASAKDGFKLFAGFDHRVTEGREVMAFLGELRERLLSFSSPELTVLSASVCAFCGRSATEAVSSSKEKGLLKLVAKDGSDMLCCGSCWSGW